MPRPLPLFIRAAAGAVMLAAALAGCGEKDVPVVVDRDILLRYLATSEDAVDLFRTTGLVPTEEYRIPNDPARYRIVVDSTRRIITLDTEIDTVKKRTWPDGSVEYYRSYHDYGNPFGRLWASEATVDDYFYVRLSRTEDEETATASHVWAITRYGYFLKLGGDDQPYVGWKLWAYNGGAAPTGSMAVRTESGAEFAGDLAGYDQIPYLYVRECLSTSNPALPCSTVTAAQTSRQVFRRLDRLGAVGPGERLVADCRDVSLRTRYRLLSAATAAGEQVRVMQPAGPGRFVDTLQMPGTAGRLWEFLFMQDFEYVPIPGTQPPDSQLTWTGWCVPYRIVP